ncbi:hypothetical protein VTJ49DRAFT_4988 [Mycothermus thermophilus]|uniref:Cysteine protease n=1 Tax=Humicola insolens TaxID=85995 RepID=A0ABR3VRA9_HUMIN
MEVARVAGAEVGRVSRRILQKIWDPEPTNDRASNEPVWCLGRSYTLAKTSEQQPPTPGGVGVPPTAGKAEATAGPASTTAEPSLPPTITTTTYSSLSGEQAPETPPDSTASSSVDSSLAYDEDIEDRGWPPAFLDDFESRIWMTYRMGFELIPKSPDPRAAAALSFTMRLKTSFGDFMGFTSDTGWGCMIRSGQSLLANALAISRLGRDWRRTTDPEGDREILALFADDPRAPYSIHSFVKHGEVACGKYPGEWFGPSAAARCIQALVNKHESSLRVYSTGDLPDVYEDGFMAAAKPDGETFYPTLLLVCTRLGIDKINQVYEQALISTLQMEHSVGIAGGRPSQSHYFVGVQGQWLFYLDPHHPRPMLPYRENALEYTPEELASCHTRRLRQLHVEDMDPSMLIGFLIKDEDDWDNFKGAVKHVQGKSIITVSPHDPALGMGAERAEAIDEVETLSGSDDDDDTILHA